MPNMKIYVFVIFLFLFTSKPLFGLKFINGLEDIPIFKEMQYVEDSLVLFDKIDGRYVSTEIEGIYKKEEVINFYKRILPNLGWNEIKPLTFERAKL